MSDFIKKVLGDLPVIAEMRLLSGELGARLESLRKKTSALEKRTESVQKHLDRYEFQSKTVVPPLGALMREGLPLEYYVRQSLKDEGYEIEGLYQYYVENTDGSRVERSVDVHAVQRRVYTAPEDGGFKSGESWPEHDHLLVEAKQRAKGVSWIFCSLPKSKKHSKSAPAEVPEVDVGFEYRGGMDSGKGKANTKDVENGLAQLQYAHMPLYLELERKRVQWHGQKSRHGDKVPRDALWSVLVTNADLYIFTPPEEFESLYEVRDAAEVFQRVPWVVCSQQPSLHLMNHQRKHVAAVPKSQLDEISDDPKLSLYDLHCDHCETVHVVKLDHLNRFLRLVADPPRIKSLKIFLSADGEEGGNPIEIKLGGA